MIDAIGHFLFYSMPWWLQLVLLAIPVLAAFYLAVKVFGWDRVKGWIAPVVAILAAFGMISRARQQGYADRRTEQINAQDKATDDFWKEKQKVDEKPISQVDKENEKWLKP
ncbi:MAG: hypothetical protein ABI216_21725 [Devosia sp.]